MQDADKSLARGDKKVCSTSSSSQQQATMITIADMNSVSAKGQGGAPAKATDATH